MEKHGSQVPAGFKKDNKTEIWPLSWAIHWRKFTFPKQTPKILKISTLICLATWILASGQQNCYLFFPMKLNWLTGTEDFNTKFCSFVAKMPSVTCATCSRHYKISALKMKKKIRMTERKVSSWFPPWQSIQLHTAEWEQWWLNIFFWISKVFRDIYSLPILFHSQWTGTLSFS